MRVAAGGDVAQPEAFFSVVVHYADDVLAVRGNGGAGGLAGVGYLRDVEALKGNGGGAIGEQGVEAVAGAGHEQQHREDDADERAFVLLGCRDY